MGPLVAGFCIWCAASVAFGLLVWPHIAGRMR